MTESHATGKPVAPTRLEAGKLFCFGLGYSASHIALQLVKEGWEVSGTCRDPAQKPTLAAAGITLYPFDGTAPMAHASKRLQGVSHILSSVPTYPEMADPVLDYHFDDIADLTSLAWVGYLSTTGVYGDRQGGWVDENDPLEPTGERGRRRVTAEARWMDLWWDADRPVHCFRLAGIYGPGKSALDTVRAGRARRIHKAGQVFSRIHIDDIAAILKASMARPNPGRVYNCCDDNPAPPEEVIAYACALLACEKPPLIAYEDARLSPMARSFYQDNKRVSNRRIKDELGVCLRWPDYREALKALL